MNRYARVVLALALAWMTAGPALAQPKASQTTTHMRVFEGPN
jgi:hypothetical protein